MQAIGNSQPLAGVFSLLAAWLFGAIAVSAQDMDRAINQDSPTATATVLDVHHCYRCDSYLLIDYTTAAGEPITMELTESYWSPEPKVGDTVVVRYNEDDPSYYVRDVRLGDNTFLPFMLWSGVVGFVAVGIAGLGNRLPRWFVNYRR